MIRIRQLLDILGTVLVLLACLSVLYNWDPTRIYVKRLKASDQYLYDTVRPELRDVDAAQFISIQNNVDAITARKRLAEVIWGEAGLPLDDLPDQISDDVRNIPMLSSTCATLEYDYTALRLRCQLDRYQNWSNLAGIDELITAVGPLYKPSIAYFRPKTFNGTLIVYQHGYAGTYHAMDRYLKILINQGYAVLASNHVGYGDIYCHAPADLSVWCQVGWGKADVPLPMRVHFSPLVTAINYGLAQGSVDRVAMIGFSAGGWLTSVMAAVDTRITNSYTVAAFMPPYLQRDNEQPPNQRYKPLFKAASMLDQFVLGASGIKRRQVQIFNKFDRCCYSGERGLLYEKAVQDAVSAAASGSFHVVIDETHARHKVSRWAFEWIVVDLEATHDK